MNKQFLWQDAKRAVKLLLAAALSVIVINFNASDVFAEGTAPVLTQFEIAANTDDGIFQWEDGICYAQNLKEKDDVKILVTIKDPAFDAQNVIAEYSSDEITWNELALKDDQEWVTDKDAHSAVYYFDGTAEGEDTYQFRISYQEHTDNFLVLPDSNVPEVYETDGGIYTSVKKVVIDHCCPKLNEMIFTKPVQMFDGESAGVNGSPINTVTDADTKLYYDQDARVQFSMTDQYLKEESVTVTVYQRDHHGNVWEVCGEDLSVTQSDFESGKTYSFTMPSEEMEYYFTVSCTDRAGNFPLYADSITTTEILEAYENGIPENKATYISPVFVKDTTAPVWSVEYNNEPAVHNSVESIKTILTVRERNLDLDKTLVKISSKDINGKNIQAAGLEGFIYDSERQLYFASWADLLKSGTAVSSDKDSFGVQTLTLVLTTEANYKVFVDIADKVTKSVTYTKEYSIDRTAPFITIVTDDGNFTRIINKVTFQYFTQTKPVVKVKVHDSVSGAASLITACIIEGKEFENYEVSKPKMMEGDQSALQYEITLPADFKGSIQMQGIDNAKNMDKDGRIIGLIAETKSKHDQLAFNKIEVLTKSPKTPNYYPGDVKVKFTSVDGYSGLYKASYRAGSYSETVLYPEGEEICLEAVKEHTISSLNNNENNIKLALEFEDHAAHKAVIAEKDIPKVHIDITEPKIAVEYDNSAAENEKYYKEPRTAIVTITERNFDPADTKLEITGPDVSISEWKHMAGNGCRAGSNPKDTYHTDGCRWKCHIEFREDGEYTFTCSTTDLAGNRADYGQIDEFVIDQTVPQIKVTYDNYDARNEFYYNKKRAAAIEITEQHFRASDVNVMMTAALEEGDVGKPALSGWIDYGDVHKAAIVYDYDADFTFDISYTDLAGNEAADYEEDKFTVDLTAPEIEIFDIENFSANSDAAAPGIRCSDTNYDADRAEVLLSGYRNGTVEIKGVRKVTANGVEFKLNDFERIPEMDDQYTMKAVAYDLAGNSSEASVMFSVNRFGSVYTFDEKTEALVGEKGSYYTDEAQELVVMETNVDTLEFQEITLNLNGKLKTLAVNEDYEIEEEGSETSWKRYTYRIYKENFEEEGTYILTIYSEDRAANISDNNTKGKNIEFVVDKTNPGVVITGVEHKAYYRKEAKEVTLDVEDSVGIGGVSVILNGKISTYTGAEVIASNGKITFTVESFNDWQTLKVIVHDAAGNRTETEEMTFLITPNVWVQFYRNQPVFLGTLGSAALLMGGVWYALAKKKKAADN